jgi:hypothetical protein
MSVKTIIITQCFCKASILEFSLKNLYEWGSQLWDEHWILLKHYPINKKQNEEEIRAWAAKYNCKIHDCGGDIGAHHGLNHFFDNNPQPKGTRYIGFDPDTLVKTKYFDIVMNQVMDAEPSIAICAMTNLAIEMKTERLRPYRKVIGGHNVIVHPNIEMMNCCMIDIDWILRNGKFNEPFKYYGCIEGCFLDAMRKENKKLAYLVDYYEAYDGLLEQHKHPEYQQWKHDHLSGFTGSLEEWLRAKGKESLL